jgi:hypothetical protein
MRELAPESRAYLCDFLGWAEPVSMHTPTRSMISQTRSNCSSLAIALMAVVTHKAEEELQRGAPHRAAISAATLRDRLPATLAAAEAQERTLYGVSDPAAIDRVLQSYRDFVALCERKERETGARCRIIASY